MSENTITSGESKRREFLKLLGAGSALTAVAASQAAAAETEPSVETVFSHPTHSGVADYSHEETVQELLAQAVPGSTVYGSIYTWTRQNMSRAFIDAAERGVDVHLILDGTGSHRAAKQMLLEELPETTKITDEGAIGDRLNHNKFLLFSELETGDQDVVWQSSSNFTWPQLTNHNTSVVIRNDTALYEGYRSYWGDMWDDEFHDMGYNRTEAGETATAYFSPRDDFDTHVRALENVVPSEDTTIHFMMSIWTDSRENESHLIENRLAELVEEGCEVNVLMPERDDTPPLLRDAGVNVMEYPEYLHRDGDEPDPLRIREIDVHSKDMLVESEFETEDGGTEWRREVWTGCQNLSRPGLRRNDEAVLRIVDDDVYRKFRTNWKRAYNQAKRIERLKKSAAGS